MSDAPAAEPRAAPLVNLSDPEVVQHLKIMREAYQNGWLPPDKAKLFERLDKEGAFGAPAAEPRAAPLVNLSDPEVVQHLKIMREAYQNGWLPPDKAKLFERLDKEGAFGAPAQPSGIMQPGGALGVPSPEPRPTQGPAMREIEIGSALALNAQQDTRLLQGYDPSVDYGTGTGWNDAINMSRSDKPAEKQAYLAKRYGPDNVFTDRGGRFVIRTPEGKMQAVEGSDFTAALKQGTASLAANPEALAGGAIGGILGAPIGGPLGATGGAAIGAAAGGAAGTAVREVGKTLAGVQRKTVPELAATIGLGGLYEAGGEVAGRLVTGLPGVAGKLFRERWAHVTPESRDLANLTLQDGGRVPIGSLAPGLGAAKMTEDVATRLGSNYTDIPNLAAVKGRLGGFVDEVMPGQRASAMEQILDPAARVSSREAGTPLIGSVRQHAAQLEGEVENIARDADRMLTQQLGQLNAISRRAAAGDLGPDVAGAITGYRRQWGHNMGMGYFRVHALAGEQPIVPAGAVRRDAQRILKSGTPDAQGNPIFRDPQFIQRLANLPDNITVLEAQDLRTRLGELAELTNMTPGVFKNDAASLRNSVNVAFRMAERVPAAAPAVRMLRRMDELYSQGIGRFEDATLNQMVIQARTGMMPNPGDVASRVLSKDNIARAREIRNMVGPDLWRRVASADWDRTIFNATDPQTGAIDARKLAVLMRQKDRDGLLELTYGPGLSREMRLYSQRLDARGGEIPADALPLDNFGHNMRAMDVATREREGFLSNNYLSELAKPGKEADEAVGFVLQPGKEERLVRALDFFGPDSREMHAIRQQALKEVMNSAIVRNDSGSTITVAGDGIERALKNWTPRQQEIMFPNDLDSDMKLLAQQIRFMFPRTTDAFGGGLAAGNIKADPLWQRIVPSAMFTVPAWIMTRPSVTRIIANGLAPSRGRGEILAKARQDVEEQILDGRIPKAIGAALLAARPTKAEMRETIRMLFRAEASGELSADDEPEPGVMSAGGASGEMMQRSTGPRAARQPIPSGLRPARDLRPSVSGP
jgi:hypothetical protein